MNCDLEVSGRINFYFHEQSAARLAKLWQGVQFPGYGQETVLAVARIRLNLARVILEPARHSTLRSGPHEGRLTIRSD